MKKGNDRGMTLIEIVIAMAVMALIAVVIAASIFVSLQTTRESNQRLTDAVGVSFTSAYFVPDAESALTVVKGPSGDCVLAGTPVVTFHWDEGDPDRPETAQPQIATYSLQSQGDDLVLVRKFCNPATTQTVTVVRGISESEVECRDGSDAPDPDCSDARVVAMTLEFESDRDVTLSATRRTDDPAA